MDEEKALRERFQIDGVGEKAYKEDDSDASTDERDGSARGTWGSKAEFFLAIMGYTVGIGSVWRFPMTCSRNGGGAFMIPFFFFLIVIGGPLYYLEVCLGQFTGLSAGLSFEFCPLFRGIGLLQVVLAAIVLFYCGMILAWSYYFLYWSFFPNLPWANCDQEWNSPRCVDITHLTSERNTTSMLYQIGNSTANFTNMTDLYVNDGKVQSASWEFWEFMILPIYNAVDAFKEDLMRYKVLGRSSGFDEPGHVQAHLAICLLIAWATVVLAVIKGIKTLGKVVYVTATVPYFMLTVVLIRALTLDGSTEGILFYLRPDFTKLAEAQVWIDAAIQVFYSLGPGWGGVITMASYNKFHQQSFWSSTMCVVSSGFTSFYNGLVVFSIIGFMASETNTDVEVVARQSGPGLVFVAFPTAISKLPLPQLWGVLFFLTFITIAYDSVFGMFETVTSCVVDMFPRRLMHRRALVNIAVGICFFLSGLPFTLNSGIYTLQVCEWYFGRYALLFSAILECVTLCWLYGTDRFSKDIELMTGRKVSAPLRIVWSIVIPFLALVVLVIVCAKHSPPDYGDGYVYSPLSRALGMFIGLSPILAMVVSGIMALRGIPGSLCERLKDSLRPSSAWKPNDPDVCKTYRLQYQECNGSIWEKLNVNICGEDS